MRFVLRLLAALVVLVAVVIGGVLALPAERLGTVLASQLSTQLGRSVTIGAARVALWPAVGIRVDGLTIADAPWAGDAPMVSANSAAFALDPMAALRGAVVVRGASLDAPDLRLTRRADGTANWMFDALAPQTAAPASDAPQSAPALVVERVSISDARVTFTTPNGTTTIEDAAFTAEMPARDGPLTVTAAWAMAGQPIGLTARIDAPLEALSGATTPLTLTLGTPGGEVGFAGTASRAPMAEGTLSVDLNDTGAAARAAGAPLALPDGLGRRVSGTVAVDFTPDRTLTVRSDALRIDQNSVALAATVTLQGKPVVDARLNAGRLDLSALSGGAGGAEAGSPEGWDTTPIDASALGAVDGTIALAADSIALGDLTLTGLDTIIAIDNSRATATVNRLGVFGGSVAGTLIANNRNGLSARATLDMTGIALREALAEAGIDRLEGPLDGRIDVLVSGASVAQMMASMSGDGAISAGPGVIRGIDLAAAFGGDPTGGTTVFNTATASFAIEGGVARNRDLAMDLPVLEASGTGAIDLGQRRIDYTLSVGDPTARDGRGLTLPVRLRGPWSDVAIRVDAEALVQQNLEEEADAARDRAQDAIADQLGVTRQEGESVEDAVRRELEDRARDGLRDLFNR